MTLLEVLIAMSILVIIIGTCYVAFDTCSKCWTRSEANIDRVQNARASLDIISRMMRSALLNDATSTTYRMIQNAWGLYLTTTALMSAGSNVYDGGFGFDAGGNEVWRWINSPPDGTMGPGKGTVSGLADGVTGLSFEYGYYDDLNRTEPLSWSATWDSTSNGVSNFNRLGMAKSPDGLPDAVRMGIAVQDSRKIEAARLFYTTVSIPGAE